MRGNEFGRSVTRYRVIEVCRTVGLTARSAESGTNTTVSLIFPLQVFPVERSQEKVRVDSVLNGLNNSVFMSKHRGTRRFLSESFHDDAVIVVSAWEKNLIVRRSIRNVGIR